MQVVENVAVRQERLIARVTQVAERGQHPAGVGVHGRPDTADAATPRSTAHRASAPARRSSARTPGREATAR